MHCSRIFFDFGVIILLRLLLALFTCIIIGGVNNLLRWVGIQPASVKVHFVERLGGHRSHQAPCHSTPFATSSCWGKKDETFTQQLLQSAVAIAALHLILELLTKVLSLSLSFFSVAAGRRAFSALFCSDLWHPSDGIIATASAGCCQQHCRKVYAPVGLCIPQPSPSASPPWRLEFRLWVSRLAALPRHAEVET